MRKLFVITGLLLGQLNLCLMAVAHESPNDKIDTLSHQLSADGPSPDLLLQRGIEYRAIGDIHRAELDLKLALHLDAQFSEAYVALGNLYLRDDKHQKSLEIIQQGFAHTQGKALIAKLHSLEAEAYQALEEPESALLSINKALAQSPSDLHWILLKCSLLKSLGRDTERITVARMAYEENKAVVLSLELIDALRDAGEYQECLKRINDILAKRRNKAEWYLRRAEVYRAMKKEKKVHADATRALIELQQRLDAHRPAVHLYEDMAHAHKLLGDTVAMNETLAKIKELNGEDESR